MLAAVQSAVLAGLSGAPVDVEVHVTGGLPGFHLVGLADAAGRESRERVRAALVSSDLDFPLRRITVNLAPASVPKVGSGFELAIALGLLVADGRVPQACLDDTGVLGELGLDGRLRPVAGCLALVDALVARGATTVIVPEANATEAGLVPGAVVRSAATVREIRDVLVGDGEWVDQSPATPEAADATSPGTDALDLADVRGLTQARTALEACAAGRHHLLLVGPPGAGKTMLARRLQALQPPLGTSEALEVARIRSASGEQLARLPRDRPWRAPRHSASPAALIGGGSARPTPGEVTRAHRGVLFLDEIAEFPPSALDALRQPIEDRSVCIARQRSTAEFPADFTLLGCANPCPCGRGDIGCRCSERARARFRVRISAPLLDRFDLRLNVVAPPPDAACGPSTEVVRRRVLAATDRQDRRFAGRPCSAMATSPVPPSRRRSRCVPPLAWRGTTSASTNS